MGKQYVVPEDGLSVALSAWNNSYGKVPSTAFKAGLEAFIRWQSENPQVPTAAQARELIGPMVVLNETSLIMAIEAWQRRMYDAPELEPSQFSNLTKIEEGLNDALDKILLTYPQIIKTFPGIREKARGHFHSGIEELKKQKASEPKKTVQDWPILNLNCGEPGDFYRSPIRCLDCGNYFKSNSCPCKKKPEPEVPEEIKDLLRGSFTREAMIEAYWRGQERK